MGRFEFQMMLKIKKILAILLVCLFTILIGCETGQEEDYHTWDKEIIKEATCTEEGIIRYTKGSQVKEEAIEALGHDYEFETFIWDGINCKAKFVCSHDSSHCELYDAQVEEKMRNVQTCVENGVIEYVAKYGEYTDKKTEILKAPGHKYIYKIIEESINGSIGTKQKICEACEMVEEEYKYVNNGFSRYGKLHVEGANLVDKDNNPVQLIGLSTHGLHWYGEYVNEASLAACKESFNINVYRFSLYTSEKGYCECSATEKERLYQLVVTGVKIATKLDMYAIVDWHMLGEENKNDKDPNYYKEQAKEFFDRITKELADYDNVLYEIMNEPNGRNVTWVNQCKPYAEEIIPIIRANKPDAIVLVGNPNCSSDLTSPRRNPLSFANIMYTFHFYAGDEDMQTTSEVTRAYSAGLPIFISEHGGMDADGNGSVDYESIARWYKALDERNISYVAWNISHKNESSGILKSKTTNLDDFSNENLKPWGLYYKNHIKDRLGLK